MKKVDRIHCLVCGWSLAEIVKEPKYNGYRGNCKKCRNNWPES